MLLYWNTNGSRCVHEVLQRRISLLCYKPKFITSNGQAEEKQKAVSFWTKAFKARLLLLRFWAGLRMEEWKLTLDTPRGLCKPLNRSNTCLGLQDHLLVQLFHFTCEYCAAQTLSFLILLWPPPVYWNSKEFTLNICLYQFGVSFTLSTKI